MLDPNQTYIVNTSQHDAKLVDKFQTKLEWAWRIIKAAEPKGISTKRNPQGPDIIWTTFASSFVNRLGTTKPVHIFAGLTAHDKPFVRISIRDLQRGHTTTFQEPLRLDGSNRLDPHCSIEQVTDQLNRLYGSAHKTAHNAPPEESHRSIWPDIERIENIANSLIHASRDYDPSINEHGCFMIRTGKPYSLPQILYAPLIYNDAALQPLLTQEASSALMHELPPLLSLVNLDTSRTQGFELDDFRAQPFRLSPRLSAIDEMKILARFPETESGYTLPIKP